MPLLASPWKRTHREKPEPTLDEPIVEVTRPDPSSTIDRLLVVRPTEGGLAFRLYGFPDVEAANEYIHEHLWLEAQQGVRAFWARHDPPFSPHEGADALVIVRDPYHPGVVQLYSFVDMEAAQERVRDEFRNGIDLNLVLVYWAYPAEIAPPPDLVGGHTPERDYFAMPTLDRHTSAAPPHARPRPAAPAVEPAASASPAPAPSAQAATAAAPAPVRSPDVSPADDAVDGEIAEKQGPSWLSTTAERIMSWPGWDGLVPHMAQAAILSEDAYEEACHDKHGTGRARLIVALAVIVAGFGALGAGVLTAAGQMMFTAAGWLAFWAVVYMFGTYGAGGRQGKVARTHLLRTLGLAAAPAIFLTLGIIPVYGAIPVLGVYVWLFLTSVHAISPALELDQNSSVVTAAFGALTFFAVAQVAPLLLL